MKRGAPVTRRYRMAARADAAAETHRRLVDAALERLTESSYDEVSLADVARDAGVTVQTVLRRFGSKERLAEAAAAAGTEAVRRERFATAPGDVAAAMAGLAAHYDAWGARSLRLLGQEERAPALRRAVAAGRALHHEWVEHAFGPQLAAVKGAARARRKAKLAAVTDVYTWKVLRRDLGLDAKATARAMRELVAAVLATKEG